MNNNFTKMSLILIILILCTFIFGCSQGSSPMVPDNAGTSLPDDEGTQPAGTAGHGMLGVYGFEFDEEEMTLAQLPVRKLAAHFDVSYLTQPPHCGGLGCLRYEVTGWDPINRILDVDATLENPTQLTAYDVRLIFRHFIKRELLNVDSYTTNFDPVGKINPFIAFAKVSVNRMFGPSPTQITEHVKIYWPVGAESIVLNIVDACWPGHCQEPYEINNIKTTGPITPGGSTELYCDVWDWQANVDWVRVDTTPLTGGYTYLMPTPVGNTWTATIYNTSGAPDGDYPFWIEAHSSGTGDTVFDTLYHKVVITVKTSHFKVKGTYALPPGSNSLDIGIIGSELSSVNGPRILITGDSPEGVAPGSAIDAYTEYYGSRSTYKSLVNLDPFNASYQPWPVSRIDASNDGAAGWSNHNANVYLQPGYTPPEGIPNRDIYSNIDRNTAFSFLWPNDHRHFLTAMISDTEYFPVDVCDDFIGFQYSLLVNHGTEARVMGFEGAPVGNYLNNDIVFYASLTGFVGSGPGQVEPGDYVAGIDAWRITFGMSRIFILETGSEWAVEVFDITNTAQGWGLDKVQWMFSIPFPESMKPLDCELLPENEAFWPNPFNPTLSVLVMNVVSGIGDIYFYDASDGTYVGSLSSLGAYLSEKPIPDTPLYIDNDDARYEIHVVQTTPQVTVFEWT